RSRGIEYADHFSNIHEVVINGDKINFSIQPNERLKQQADKYKIHPALMDSFVQPLFGMLPEHNDRNLRTTWLSSFREVQYFGNTDYNQPLNGYAVVSPVTKISAT